MSSWRRGLKPHKDVIRTPLQQAGYEWESARNALLYAHSFWLNNRTEENQIKLLAAEERVRATTERYKQLEQERIQNIRQQISETLAT